ncbi:MAG: NTP transferase domain-containing protein, partial [Actinomycetota bacterium]
MRPPRSRLSAARQHSTKFALGAVLVGGASRRFGSDKAAAQFRGRTLLDTALLTLGGVGLAQ